MTTKSIIQMLYTLFLATAALAAPEGFVTKDGDRLMLNGSEYRAIGVNIPQLSKSYIGTWFHNNHLYKSADGAKQAMTAAVEDAAKSGFKFIRFFADPGYPISIDKLYASNPEEYWERMDEVMALCRRHDLRVVPNLNVIWSNFADLHGEPRQAILHPGTKTHTAVYRYMQEFVSRYKDDPVVLMWELNNEGLHKADIDMTGKKGMQDGLFTGGKNPRPVRTIEDSFNYDMYRRIYSEMTSFIKKIDPNHLVTSGDSAVRYECTSRRETFPNFRYRDDTFREWLANNLFGQPEPLDVFSYHLGVSGREHRKWGMRDMEWMRRLLQASLATNTPVYIGELGQDHPFFGEDPEGKLACEFIDMAEEIGVSLITLWVWHFPWQPERTLSGATHPELVEHCRTFNRKYSH